MYHRRSDLLITITRNLHPRRSTRNASLLTLVAKEVDVAAAANCFPVPI